MHNVREYREIAQSNCGISSNDVQKRKLTLEAEIYRYRAILEVSHSLKRKALECKRKVRELEQITTIQ